MRFLLALTLFAGILGLSTGCGLTKRFKDATARNSSSGGDRFLGAPSSDSSSSSSASAEAGSDTLASKQSNGGEGMGFLAGSVLDSARRRVPKATIKISEIDPPKERADVAPLSVLTDNNGWFILPDMHAGRNYRLEARVRDGNRMLSGSIKAQCPNIKLAIALTRDEPATGQDKETGIEKTAKEDRPTSPGKLLPPKTPQNSVPAVPLPSEDDTRPPPPPSSLPSPSSVPSILPPVKPENDPSLIAEGKAKNGFEKAPAVNVPGPGREPNHKSQAPYVPPPAPMKREGISGLSPSSAPSAVPGRGRVETRTTEPDELPSSRLVVPSCVRVGDRVNNFALYDYDGNAWEMKKKRKGQLMLLDFWFSSCPPCKDALPWLSKLDRDYRQYGLQVIGIAHEEGTLAEKQDAVRAIRRRAQIDYPILFTGGGASKVCPVLKQFEVHQYPTLILLDESGKVVWRGTGSNPRTKTDLEMDIRRRLGFRDR